MTKKKTKRQDPTAETETPELSAAQVYGQQLQQVLDAWPEKALQLLAEDIGALDAPADAREIKPRPLPAALRQLVAAGKTAVDGWTVMPPAPPAAEFERPEPSETAKARAAQIRRIEDGYVYTVDMRRFVNEDRARAGLPPLPPSEDEALTSDKQE